MIITENPFTGTWKLVSWTNTTDEGEVTFPYSKDPVGFLIYTEDGFMLVEIMDPDRHQSNPQFPSEPAFRQTLPDHDRIMAYNTFVAYGGTYTFSLEEKKMVHHVKLGLIPGWTGYDQVREFEFNGVQLILGGRNSRLIWESS